MLFSGVTRRQQRQTYQKLVLRSSDSLRIHCEGSFVFLTGWGWAHQHSLGRQEPNWGNRSDRRGLIEHGATSWREASWSISSNNRRSHWSWQWNTTKIIRRSLTINRRWPRIIRRRTNRAINRGTKGRISLINRIIELRIKSLKIVIMRIKIVCKIFLFHFTKVCS